MIIKEIKFFDLYFFLASVFCIGLINFFPGTLASLVSLFFWLIIYKKFSHFFLWLIIVISFFLGIKICKKVSYFLIHDSSVIVLDEFIGMWIPLMALKKVSFFWVFFAFFSFRFFDIVKPWPINLCDRKIRNGFGIILDDFLAGFFSFFLIFLLNTLFF